MDYQIQKIILSYLPMETISTIIDRGLLKQFDVLTIDKYWKKEAMIYSITISPIGINYYRDIYKICMECGRHNAKSYFNYILCKKCTKTKKYKSISRAVAHIKYGVTDDNLLKIRRRIREDDAKSVDLDGYYLEHEVKLLTNNRILENREKRSYRRKYGYHHKRWDPEGEQKREHELIEELGKYGLQLRSDSTVCYKYIRGYKEKNINEVVEKMCTMKYLFEYTEYSKLMKELIIKQKYMFVAFDKHEMRAIVKKQILESNGGKWPSPWPWMNL